MFALGLGLAALTILLVVLWSPERQVRLHQEHLIRAVAKKDWARLAPFIADDYSDRWGQDKANALLAARTAFEQFIFLKITMEDPAVNATGEAGRVVTRFSVTGNGGPLAQIILERADELREPFTFDWQQRSWKPWDWALVRVEQRELQIPDL